MNQRARPLFVLLKGCILFAVANLAFAYFHLSLGRLSVYNWLVPGRQRVPYEREVAYYDVAHTVPVYEDMDAMYASHVLSQPKAADEYRVFLLGDSSAWGFDLTPAQTLAGQLTALGLHSCDGKRIVVYNAAFPLPYVMKDLLIMDRLRAYQPDMFVWSVSLDAFRNRTIYTYYFLDPYAERVRQLAKMYDLTALDLSKLSTPTLWSDTIVAQRSLLKRIFDLQLYGPAWSATDLDYDYIPYPPLSNDQSDSLLFEQYSVKTLDLNKLLFDVLAAGSQVAGQTPLLVINEPIFIATGKNSDVRYNSFYPRWAYDAYLAYMNDLMHRGNHPYVDAWNALPNSEFTSTPFHRAPNGEKTLAALIVPQLVALSCSK